MIDPIRDYLSAGRQLASQRGFEWDFPVDAVGRASKRDAWDLTELAGAVPPPRIRLSNFGFDNKGLQYVNARRHEANEPPIEPAALSVSWQDVIKAAAIHAILINRTSPTHVAGQVVRPLRLIATCNRDVDPWYLRFEHVQYALEVAEALQPSGQLKRTTEAVIRYVMDHNHLSYSCPLLPVKRNNATRLTGPRSASATAPTHQFRQRLASRRSPDRLPDADAFWELTRIVFTESPRTFTDALRFAQVQTLILTGLRVGEVCMIPVDWRQTQTYAAFDGRPAGDHGGISRSLALRYFGEKQQAADTEGLLLHPQIQHTPALLEDALANALDHIVKITAPLRHTLAAQQRTGRLLPDFEPEQAVTPTELFPYLSGNPFVYEDPQQQRLQARYKESYDPEVLDRIERRQSALAASGVPLRNDVRVYFSRLRRGVENQLPCRNVRGRILKRIDYAKGWFVVSEVEAFIREMMPTKLPDTGTFRSTEDREIGPDAFLFVGPKRCLVEERNAGICDIRKYFGIARVDSPDLMRAVGDRGASTSGERLFQKYGKNKTDAALRLELHSLRHLQNTELFRLGIADTIITKRFGRRSVAQSYDYDHRSLAEELEAVDVPKGADDLLPPKAQQILRMITTGKVHGRIVEEFRRIQQQDGDNAAFEFLAVEADGFHTTPYGFCINSFTVDPCPKHLECYNGCRHLSISQLPEHRDNLLRLKGQFQKAKQQILDRPSNSIGRDNQLAHAEARLAGIQRILECECGDKPFPDGPDLSEPVGHPTSRSIVDE